MHEPHALHDARTAALGDNKPRHIDGGSDLHVPVIVLGPSVAEAVLAVSMHLGDDVGAVAVFVAHVRPQKHHKRHSQFNDSVLRGPEPLH